MVIEDGKVLFVWGENTLTESYLMKYLTKLLKLIEERQTQKHSINHFGFEI